MKKELLLTLFAGLIALQVATPVLMITQREGALKGGETFRFKTAPVDPYDAFRGRYVAIRVDVPRVGNPAGFTVKHQDKVFAFITNGPDGYAQVTGITRTRPKGQAYLSATVRYPAGDGLMLDLPIDRYYMTEKAAPRAEQVYREHSRAGQQDAYVIVKVKDGMAVVEGLYVNGQRIEDLLKTK
jgi:uncharacterized membrane-anchored protein